MVFARLQISLFALTNTNNHKMVEDHILLAEAQDT
jgi:hypothetical protein